MAGEPDGSTLMGGDPNPNPNNPGNQNAGDPPAWMAQLPDDLKTNEALAKHATIGDVSKGFLDLSGKLDGSVKVPGEEATDKEKSSFFNAIGRPETADKYEFTRPDLPAGIEYDEAQEKTFREAAHTLGLSQSQAKALFDDFNQNAVKAHKEYSDALEKTKEEAVVELKKDWGEKFDGNVEVARRAMSEFGGPEVVRFMETSGLGNNPILVKLFNQIGIAMSEDKLHSGNIHDEGERPRSISGVPMLDFPSMDKQ